MRTQKWQITKKRNGKVKVGSIVALALTTFVVIVVIFSYSNYLDHHSGVSLSNKLHANQQTGNPYLTIADVIKVPVQPIIATQTETGYEYIIIDGFTSTITTYDLTNIYESTSVSGGKEIASGTITTKIGENANYDYNSSVWTVYRTIMGVRENKVVSFVTNNYQPEFDILQYYYEYPHYITYTVHKNTTTPLVYMYLPNGTVMTLTLAGSNGVLHYSDDVTYTTTISNKVETVVLVHSGIYSISKAKYATEILPIYTH